MSDGLLILTETIEGIKFPSFQEADLKRNICTQYKEPFPSDALNISGIFPTIL